MVMYVSYPCVCIVGVSLSDSVAMVDLLESTGVRVLSRKHLTTHTWGIVSYGCLAATNALVGGTMRDHLSCHYTRRVTAHALRDCRLVSGVRGLTTTQQMPVYWSIEVLIWDSTKSRSLSRRQAGRRLRLMVDPFPHPQALKKASQDGKWEPDLESCCRLPLTQLEVLLCLPAIMYYLLRPLCLRFASLPGPTQVDKEEEENPLMSSHTVLLCNRVRLFWRWRRTTRRRRGADSDVCVWAVWWCSGGCP